MYTPYNIFNIESNLPKYKPGGAAASNSDPDEAKVGQIFFDDSSNSWKVITKLILMVRLPNTHHLKNIWKQMD